jgi:hypothetical protein
VEREIRGVGGGCGGDGVEVGRGAMGIENRAVGGFRSLMFCARCWSFTSTDLVEGVVLGIGVAGICSNDWVNADNQPRAIEQRRLIFSTIPCAGKERYTQLLNF